MSPPLKVLSYLILLQSLIFIQIILSYRDGLLTLTQMRDKYPEIEGLPFFWHLGMWGDFFLVSPLTAGIFGFYARFWQTKQIVWSCMIAIFVTFVLKILYERNDIMQAHVKNHKTTGAGWVHLLYTDGVLSILIPFYTVTTDAPKWVAIGTTGLLCVQLFIGLNMALGCLQKWGKVQWYAAHPLRSGVGWLIFLVGTVALSWRTYLMI